MTLALAQALCLYCDNTTDSQPVPDPFDSVVFGDYTPVRICDGCYQARQEQV
jgi:hypothetical protein